MSPPEPPPMGRAAIEEPAALRRIGPFQALGFRFEVRVGDLAVAAHLKRLLGPMAAAEPGPSAVAPGVYSIVDRGPAAGVERFGLVLDGSPVGRSPSPAGAVSLLVWDVNRLAVERSPEYVLLHAAALEHAGTGLVLVGPSGAGKSTLAAGLLQAGLGYLSDEVTAVKPATLELVPYPKPLAIEAGSWPALSGLGPTSHGQGGAGNRDGDGDGPEAGETRLVEPAGVGPAPLAGRCRPGFVVVIGYAEGATTELTPLSPTEALVALAEGCFGLVHHGQRGLTALADVVRTSACARLRVGDLGAACRLLLDLVERGPSPRHA